MQQKIVRVRKVTRRVKSKGAVLVLFGLIAGVGFMSTPTQNAAAQMKADEAEDLALVPGAPSWAEKASSNVWLRFTKRWQRLEAEAAKMSAKGTAPGDLPIAAAVTFGAHVFNKDTSALPQNETTVAIDPKSALRIVGGYNDYRGLLAPNNFTGWSISTDGGATTAKDGQIPPAVVLGVPAPSQGDPAVAFDKNGNLFMGSFHFPSSQNPNGVTIARSPAAGALTGVFSAACTGGSDVDCWPVRRVVRADACTSATGFFHDKPWIAVDNSSSVATGSVYIVWTRFGCASSNFSSAIVIAKCTNNLVTCTAPVVLESTPGTGGARDFVQLSHLAISPVNGKVYTTWGKRSGTSASNEQVAVRLRVITPSALATSVGTLGLLRTVQTELLPIPFGTFPYPAFYRTATYPHVAVKGARAIIVWDRRSVANIIGSFFFNSDILAKFTDNDGVIFSLPQTVSVALGPQYQPSICVDNTSGTIGVAYFSHQIDPVFTHRQDVYIATSATGAAPYTPLRVTATSNDTEADLRLSDVFIGDYIEVACRGGVGLVHYTANYVAKPTSIFTGGSPALLVRQQDTFLGKVTLP